MKQPYGIDTAIAHTLLQGFHYKDADKVLKKLAAFAAAGPDKLHVVSDFDLTLTAGKRPGDNLGTWDVMDALMPPGGVAKHDAIYRSFRPIEIAGELTQAIASEKWAETLDLITSYHMRIEDIEAAFLSVATLRPGAKALFDAAKKGNVPTVILSSGISNVIEIIATHYGLTPDYILSNDLTIDENGRVNGWYHENLVHILNKREMGHGELSRLRKTHSNVLLLGDVADDVDMVTGDDEVIRIRVIDPRKGEAYDLDTTAQASFAAGYDLVTEHSLEPAVHLLKWLIQSTE